MSDNPPKAEPRRCPACNGEMAPMQTICAKCREDLEKTAMLVRAQDYPPPARVVDSSRDPADAATSAAPLEAQLGAAVDDDLDLLPLAPLDSFAKSAGTATQSAPVSPATRASVTAPAAPAPVSVPVEMDIPAQALRPANRWKLALAVVVATVAAAALAALIWSLVVPARPSTDSPVGNTAPAQPQ